MLTSPPRTPVRAAATDAPAEMVVNTRKLAELERALLDAHSRPKSGDPPVHDWPPSVAVRQVKEQLTRGQPSELIEFAIAAKDLGSTLAQGAQPTACKPIAILLLSEEPWKVLGYTEWQADTDQPAFDTVAQTPDLLNQRLDSRTFGRISALLARSRGQFSVPLVKEKETLLGLPHFFEICTVCNNLSISNVFAHAVL